MLIHAEVLPTYRRIRQIGLRLNHKLVGTLSKEAMDTAGERLGILRNGVLVFGSEDETAVLMDYAIYNVRIAGQNAVERYLEQSPPPPDSDEMGLLKDMLEACYSLFELVDVEPGVGVTVRDALRNETDFLADIGLSRSGPMGGCLATRVIPLREQGILMSSGAGLPVDRATLARIIKALEQWFETGTDFSLLTPDQESNLAAVVIRTCLEAGMSSRIVYGTHAETSSRTKPAIDPRLIRRANPNDPCPCGSGRKFKSCCGRRPRR